MILQALNEYYERKSSTGELAPEGFEHKGIPFVIVLNQDGRLLQVNDTRSDAGRLKRAHPFLVPQTVKKSTNIAANLLWGNAEYVLGIVDPKKLKDKKTSEKKAKYRDRVGEMHGAFTQTIKSRLASIVEDPGVAAVLAFLDDMDVERLSAQTSWPEIRDKNPNLAFRLASDGNDTLVSSRPTVRGMLRAAAESQHCGNATDETGLCLVRGSKDSIERLHPPINGIHGAEPTGANIVSFNLEPFCSYGKDKGANAPVGKLAAFHYTTALNHLLRKDSSQRIQVGDASTVFWAADKSGFENSFAAMFSDDDGDDADRGAQAVRNLFEATRTGVYLPDDKDTRFYVLGLAPNAARVAVRFWNVGTVASLAIKIAQHFDDIRMISVGDQSPFIGINALLVTVARVTRVSKERKKPNIIYWRGHHYDVPPDLVGDTMRAILTGLPYPAMLLQSAVRRCRAEQAARNPNTNVQLPNVPYPRAAVIKASLNRLIRNNHFQARMLTMSLDKENKDVPYLLGRLFAAFERLQQTAHKSDTGSTLNRTIRESYYGAASSSPSSVFPTLVKLHQHHLSKLEKSDHSKGLAHYFRGLIGEIFAALPAVRFPAHLNLPNQGLFAIGYYQQLQSRKPNSDDDNKSTEPEGEH